MPQLDFPDSPLSGDIYNAPNGVTYTYDTSVGPVGVWIAAATAPVTPLTITSPGTISGSPQVGASLSYTTGTATGGTGAIGYTWQWFITPSTPLGAADAPTVTVPAGALGQNIYVKLTATDSATPTPATATADTANFPSSGTIAAAGITGAAAPTTIPGTASFTWTDGNQNLSATGCIEFSVNGGVSFTQSSTAVGNGTTVITQWKDVAGSGTCGDAPHNTTITGTLTDGTLTSTFNFQIDRVPNSFSLSPNTENTTPLTTTVDDPSFTLGGCNTAPLVWGVLTGGGTNPQFSTDGGTTWVNLPSAPTSGVNVPVGVATIVRFTTSAAAGTETLDVFAGASTTAGEYHSALFTVTVASTPFPNSTFTPSGAPNASPASVSTGSLHGTATCASWADGSVSLTSTGGIVFDVNATGTFGAGPTSIIPGDSIEVIWDPTVIAGAADGAILNGTLTDGVYTNTYSLTVSRAVTGLAFTDLTNQALSTAVTSNVITPAGFNVPVSLSYVGSTNAMTAIGVAVGGGGFLASPQTVNPGQTLQVQGTTGGTISTPYGVTLTMGSGPVATDTWTATTVAATPAVTTPSISTPANNATGVGTASGINITSSPYSASGGAGTHASSDWELYANAYPLTSSGTIGTVTPGTAGTPSYVVFKTSASADPNPALAQNDIYGKIPQDNAIAAGQPSGTYPAFEWADGLNFNGYSDWYLPSFYEQAILYVNLKPNLSSNQNNSTTRGINPYSVPPRASNYTLLNPNQTTATNFQVIFGTYGSEAFREGDYYWGATESSGTTGNTCVQVFSSGTSAYLQKNYAGGLWARAIRRIPIAEYTAAGSPAIGSYLAGGFYGGQISTAGNGTADYALIVAPNAQGTYGYTGGTNASFTINGADTDGFQVGFTIKGNTSNATGIILSVNATTIEYLPTSGTFITGETISTDPASYTLASSATASTTNLVSWPVAKPPLTANTTYYTRVRYTSNATVVTSDWSGWSKFTTGALLPTPGATWTSGVTAYGFATNSSGAPTGGFVATPSYSSGPIGTATSTGFTTVATNPTAAVGNADGSGTVLAIPLNPPTTGAEVIVYKSTDDGVSFTTNSLGAIANAPSGMICWNPVLSKWYALGSPVPSGGWRRKIVESTDGINWSLTFDVTGLGYAFQSLFIDEVTGRIAATYSDPNGGTTPIGFYLSNTAGTSFSIVTPTPSFTQSPVVIGINNNNIIAAATSTTGGVNCYRYSTDNGSTWSQGSLPNGSNTTGNVGFRGANAMRNIFYAYGYWWAIVIGYGANNSVSVMTSANMVNWNLVETIASGSFLFTSARTSSGVVFSGVDASNNGFFKFYS